MQRLTSIAQEAIQDCGTAAECLASEVCSKRQSLDSSSNQDASTSHVQVIRKNVMSLLEARLADRFLKGKCKAAKIAQIAGCLEQYMFQTAPSLEEYADLSTLESRMNLVLTVKLQRCLTINSKKNRTQFLRQCLGKERYYRVQDLVRWVCCVTELSKGRSHTLVGRGMGQEFSRKHFVPI